MISVLFAINKMLLHTESTFSHRREICPCVSSI